MDRKRLYAMAEANNAKERNNRERSLANLRPFKPGQSGNPSGRPQGSISLLTIIKRKLGEADPETKAQVAERVADAYLARLRDGDPRILQDYLDRTDGKPRQGLDLAMESGPLVVIDRAIDAVREPVDSETEIVRNRLRGNAVAAASVPAGGNGNGHANGNGHE